MTTEKETKQLDPKVWELAKRSLAALNIPQGAGITLTAALLIDKELSKTCRLVDFVAATSDKEMSDMAKSIIDEYNKKVEQIATKLLKDNGYQEWDRTVDEVKVEAHIASHAANTPETPPWVVASPTHDCHGNKYREKEFVEIVPGITVSKKLIESAAPTTGATKERDDYYEQVSKRKAELRSETLKDIEISKKITDSIIGEDLIKKYLKDGAECILAATDERERDKTIAFINVTEGGSQAAAKRVLHVKDSHPEWEVEPIDLTGILESTKPLAEHHIEELQPVMHIKKHVDTDNLPMQIIFAVPSVNLPVKEGIQENGTYILPGSEEVSYEMQRYMHIDSMPSELKRVMQAYRSIRSSSQLHGVKWFKEAVAKLHEIVQALPDDKQDVVVPMVPAAGCADPRGRL